MVMVMMMMVVVMIIIMIIMILIIIMMMMVLANTLVTTTSTLTQSIASPQIEDILKRSFAEFYAQRATPELLQAVQAGSQVLARLHDAPWPASHVGSTREQVTRFFELTGQVHEALGGSAQADMLLSRGAEPFLKAGCVAVMTRDEVAGIPEMVVVLGDAPTGAVL